MRNINNRIKRKERLYYKKTMISFVLWFLGGFGVLGFGIYLKDWFEIGGGIVLIILSSIQLIEKNRIKKPTLIIRKERKKLLFLSFCIIIFSLINPIGIIAPIYDIFKRDWVMRGGFDEE